MVLTATAGAMPIIVAVGQVYLSFTNDRKSKNQRIATGIEDFTAKIIGEKMFHAILCIIVH